MVRFETGLDTYASQQKLAFTYSLRKTEEKPFSPARIFLMR
jgi:hypothetical protein